jgi:hypothetical protein
MHARASMRHHIGTTARVEPVCVSCPALLAALAVAQMLKRPLTRIELRAEDKEEVRRRGPARAAHRRSGLTS